jgi:hypothetical protein
LSFVFKRRGTGTHVHEVQLLYLGGSFVFVCDLKHKARGKVEERTP